MLFSQETSSENSTQKNSENNVKNLKKTLSLREEDQNRRIGDETNMIKTLHDLQRNILFYGAEKVDIILLCDLSYTFYNIL